MGITRRSASRRQIVITGNCAAIVVSALLKSWRARKSTKLKGVCPTGFTNSARRPLLKTTFQVLSAGRLVNFASYRTARARAERVVIGVGLALILVVCAVVAVLIHLCWCHSRIATRASGWTLASIVLYLF
jgi:hypothetical protein